jgi:trk system potassium uptake protein TrkA
MNIVVVGCGRVGSYLAELLNTEGHNVAVIDKDINSFDRLSSGFKGQCIHGDALDIDILNKAKIENADALASVTNSDSLNATIAMIAKKKFLVPKIAIRVFDPSDAEVYRKLGICITSPTEWAANFIRDVLVHPEVYPKLAIGSGDVQIVELVVPHTLVGRPIDYVNIPQQVRAIAVVRQGRAIIPYDGMIFEDSDFLTLAVSTLAMKRVEELMGQ